MILTEDRIYHLSNLILDKLRETGIAFLRDETQVKKEVRQSIFEYLRLEEGIDEKVRKKISSQSKIILEGSREWEILYKKYYEEEASLKGLSDKR